MKTLWPFPAWARNLCVPAAVAGCMVLCFGLVASSAPVSPHRDVSTLLAQAQVDREPYVCEFDVELRSNGTTYWQRGRILRNSASFRFDLWLPGWEDPISVVAADGLVWSVWRDAPFAHVVAHTDLACIQRSLNTPSANGEFRQLYFQLQQGLAWERVLSYSSLRDGHRYQFVTQGSRAQDTFGVLKDLTSGKERQLRVLTREAGAGPILAEFGDPDGTLTYFYEGSPWPWPSRVEKLSQGSDLSLITWVPRFQPLSEDEILREGTFALPTSRTDSFPHLHGLCVLTTDGKVELQQW